MNICHKCFGCNCRSGKEFFINASEFLKPVSGTEEQLKKRFAELSELINNDDMPDLQIATEYLMIYRELNKQLVPRM